MTSILGEEHLHSDPLARRDADPTARRGCLAEDEGHPGGRTYQFLGTGLNRSARATDPPGSLRWETAPLETDVDVVGDLELRLDASATAGWPQASLRAVDEQASRPGRPVLPRRDRADWRCSTVMARRGMRDLW